MEKDRTEILEQAVTLLVNAGVENFFIVAVILHCDAEWQLGIQISGCRTVVEFEHRGVAVCLYVYFHGYFVLR